jgi:hypothetical protein
MGHIWMGGRCERSEHNQRNPTKTSRTTILGKFKRTNCIGFPRKPLYKYSFKIHSNILYKVPKKHTIQIFLVSSIERIV